MKTFILLFTFLSTTSLLASSLNYSLRSSDKVAGKNQITYTFQWATSDDLYSVQRDFLGIKSSAKREVLIASFNFFLPKGMDKFAGKYFENMRLLEQLSGMNYKKGSGDQVHNISFKPHPLKTITAVGHIKMLNDTAQVEQVFSMASAKNQIVIHQTVTKFSDYFDRTDIVTQVVEEGDGTHFTIYSAAVLNANESNSTLLGVTKTAMLSKLKDQMKMTPDVFMKN